MPLRVISGSAGGLHLKSPKRHQLRPTQDRIRQVILSSLAELIPGARVLDLFAGTGALGIEALSRGAASATFIEENKEAVLCIRDNLSHCHLQGDVRQAEVFSYLQKPPAEPFDIIFADPPYKKTSGNLDDEPILKVIIPFLPEANGVFVWEHYAGQQLQSTYPWELMRHRNYGETGLTFLRLLHKNKKISL